jgi:hypothetical protein
VVREGRQKRKERRQEKKASQVSETSTLEFSCHFRNEFNKLGRKCYALRQRIVLIASLTKITEKIIK